MTKNLRTPAPLRDCSAGLEPDLAAELALARAVLDGRVAAEPAAPPAATGTVRELVEALEDASARLTDLVVLARRLDDPAQAPLLDPRCATLEPC